MKTNRRHLTAALLAIPLVLVIAFGVPQNLVFHLHKAVRANNLAAAQFWLKLGADPNGVETFNRYYTPVSSAFKLDSPDMLRLLLQHGGNTKSIHEGFLYGSPSFENMRVVVEEGQFDVKTQGVELLAGALLYGNVEIAEYLLKKGVSPNAVYMDNSYEPENQVEGNEYLYAELKSRQADGAGSMAIYALQGDSESLKLLKLLEKFGGDFKPKGVCSNHNLVVSAAIEQNASPQVLQYLLSETKSLDDMGRAEKSLLMYAAEAGDLQGFKSLYRLASPKQREEWDTAGKDLLHFAAFNTGSEGVTIASFLLKQGHKVSARDTSGQMPLTKAAENNSLWMVDFLLKHGADPNAKDNDGKAALDLTTDEKVMARLIKYGAKSGYSNMQ